MEGLSHKINGLPISLVYSRSVGIRSRGRTRRGTRLRVFRLWKLKRPVSLRIRRIRRGWSTRRGVRIWTRIRIRIWLWTLIVGRRRWFSSTTGLIGIWPWRATWWRRAWGSGTWSLAYILQRLKIPWTLCCGQNSNSKCDVPITNLTTIIIIKILTERETHSLIEWSAREF